jgi:hypothetical protein
MFYGFQGLSKQVYGGSNTSTCLIKLSDFLLEEPMEVTHSDNLFIKQQVEVTHFDNLSNEELIEINHFGNMFVEEPV